jgi:hypothetical protein
MSTANQRERVIEILEKRTGSQRWGTCGEIADEILSAASPDADLLAALKGAVGALEFSRDYHADLGNEDQAFAQDRLDAATKAISKAESDVNPTVDRIARALHRAYSERGLGHYVEGSYDHLNRFEQANWEYAARAAMAAYDAANGWNLEDAK